MTVREFIARLSELDQDAQITTFEPFDPEGPCSWVEPRINAAPDGSIRIEP